MTSLDGSWTGAQSDAIVVTIPLATNLLANVTDENRQALEDMVVGQAARKALEALVERLEA